MTRTVATREEIPAATLAKFERSWGHTGGDSEAALIDGERIVSWHKNLKAAKSALSKFNATRPVR
jgi:hypothetical protein